MKDNVFIVFISLVYVYCLIIIKQMDRRISFPSVEISSTVYSRLECGGVILARGQSNCEWQSNRIECYLTHTWYLKGGGEHGRAHSNREW